MKVLCVNNEQKVYNLLKIYFGGKMFESLKMAKCCLVFVTILTSMIMVPWSEGKTLFYENQDGYSLSKPLSENSNNDIMSLLYPLLMIIFWLLLFTGGTVAMMPLFMLSIVPLITYLFLYTFSIAAYMLLVCPPIALVLYILHTLFPNSMLINATVNITLHLLLFPIIAGGAFCIPLSFPAIGMSFLMVGWLVLSLKISIAIFGGSSAEILKDRFPFMKMVPIPE